MPDMQEIINALNKENKEIQGEATLENGKLIVVLKGVIDTYNSNLCMAAMVGLAELELSKIIVIDLLGINYVSSTGIGQFLEIQKSCAKHHTDLYFLRAQDKVKDVFKLLGFEQFLNFISSVADIGGKSSVFPLAFQCPHCEMKLRAPKAGKFRCSNCKEVITVSADGAIA
jgi:anti-sigma B factor antagonist